MPLTNPTARDGADALSAARRRGERHARVACASCGWDADGRLVVAAERDEDRIGQAGIPDDHVAFCEDCGASIDFDSVTEVRPIRDRHRRCARASVARSPRALDVRASLRCGGPKLATAILGGQR